MGFFGNLDSESYDRKYTDRQLIQRMINYFKNYFRRLLILSGLILFIGITGAAGPLLLGWGVDLVRNDPSTATVLRLFGVILTANILSWSANWLRRRITVRLVADVSLQLRHEAFSAVVRHDLSFYDEQSTGKVQSRITSDTEEFGKVVVLVTDTFGQMVQALILVVILFTIDWKLTSVLLIFLPIVFFAATAFRNAARYVTRNGMRAMANVNASIKETVSGIAVAKNFRQESEIYKDFETANISSYNVNIRRGFVLSMVFPTLNALSGVATALLVYGGGLSAAAGAISSGAWYLFIQSLGRFFDPVVNLSAFWTQIQGGLSAAERVFALIDAKSAVNQRDNKRILALRGDIIFSKVNFHYSDRQKVLKEFSLHIRPGETVALVGHTGAGKSSIAKLLARFYEFQEGEITIDGQDIRDLNLTTYRSQLGIVSQQPFLFAGTIAENICYACPGDSAHGLMEQIARQIGDGEWLDALPDGLNTMVGERGGWLSMGQRQLVSLMRVLVQQPAIFILDEATASVDPFTEYQIQQALKLILDRTTSILIAHRLSTVKAADRIIVLENGSIIQEGSHDQLMATGGHYATLYETYFRHQSLDYRPDGV